MINSLLILTLGFLIGAICLLFKLKRSRRLVPESEVPTLKPGYCECCHGRCFHTNGVGGCNCAITEDSDGKRLPREDHALCACAVYILDEDDDDGDDSPEAIPPTVDDLERMFRK